jgi:hypothetical protein
MTEQPKYYKINVDKLKWKKIDTLPYLLGLIEFPEDYEYFDEIKHVLDIPKPPKSLEEFKQELDSKFVDLLVKTKRKFALSKESAEYKFKLKCDQANSRFEYAKTYGYFSLPVTFITTGTGITVSSYSCGTDFNLNPSKNSVGYYFVEPDVKFHMTKKPNRIVRFFMRNLLNFKWVDKK